MSVFIAVCSIFLRVCVTSLDIDYPDDPSADCGETVVLSRESPEYVLQTPRYPFRSYRNDLACRWNFTALEHHHVHINVERINLKGSPSPHCSDSDKVVFTAPLGSTIGKICLATQPPPIYVRNFSVAFKAMKLMDDANLVYGFRITLTGYTPPPIFKNAT